MRGRKRRGWLEPLWSLLYPVRPCCPLCGDVMRGIPSAFAVMRLCLRCSMSVRPLTGPLCRICGRADEGPLCGDCTAAPRIVFQSRSFAAYEGAVEKAIKALKYQGNEKLFPVLSRWLLEAYEGHYGTGSQFTLVPVPMHPTKVLQRGFNQADVLARSLGKSTRLPVQSWLARADRGSSQTVRSRAERVASLSSTFRIAPAVDTSRIEGAHILLVDDVFTTGATVDACARRLFKAGAESVCALTVAR